VDILTPEETNKTLANIKSSLAEGGIGIGVPIGYLPKGKADQLSVIACRANDMVNPLLHFRRMSDV
jgi:dihydroorotase